MDIDQLVYFQSVAETRSITASAKQLGLSQPALSRSIQRLEDEFGQPFFERKSRSVELNDAGVMFQSAALQIMQIIDETKARICDDGQTGRIRIGAIPTIAPYFLPDLLRRFSKQFSKAALLIQENTTENLLRQVKQGEIDLAILAEPIAAKYVDTQFLFEEELFLVMSKDHELAEAEQVHLKDIEELPFVMLDEAHCLTDNITSFCKRKSIHPVVIERTSQIATVQELVALDHGVSMIPEMAKALDRSKRRVYRAFSGTKPNRAIVMVHNPYRYQSRLLKEFSQAVVDYASQF